MTATWVTPSRTCTHIWYRPTGRPLRSRPLRRSMISASTSGPRKTGPPPERDLPRPPRRRFLLPDDSPLELAAGACAVEGRVSPI